MSAPRRGSGAGARPGPGSRNRPADAPAGARPDRPAGPPGPARAAPKTATKATKTTKAAGVRRRSGTTDAEPAGAKRARRGTQLTGRAAVLALVVIALSLSLAYPIRQYFGQRAEIAQMREQVRQQEQRVAALQADRDRWSDPAYIRAQARKRLHYCMPGETCFVTVHPPATQAGR